MSSTFANNDRVYYTILEGANRENGLGTYLSSGNSIQRDFVFETIDDGVYSNPAPGNLSLLGGAIVAISPTTQGLTSHFPMWNRLTGTTSWNPESGYTAPTTTPLVGGIQVAAFQPSVIESVASTFVIGHDIAPATEMFFYINWSPDSLDTGAVRFGIEYSVVNASTGVFDPAVILYVEQAGSGVIGNYLQAVFTTAIASPMPEIVMQCRVFRDGTHINDTYTGNALLHTVGLQHMSSFVGTPARSGDLYSWV